MTKKQTKREWKPLFPDSQTARERKQQFASEQTGSYERSIELRGEIADLKARGQAVPPAMLAELREADLDTRGLSLANDILDAEIARLERGERVEQVQAILASAPDGLARLQACATALEDAKVAFAAERRAWLDLLKSLDDIERLLRKHPGDALPLDVAALRESSGLRELENAASALTAAAKQPPHWL